MPNWRLMLRCTCSTRPLPLTSVEALDCRFLTRSLGNFLSCGPHNSKSHSAALRVHVRFQSAARRPLLTNACRANRAVVPAACVHDECGALMLRNNQEVDHLSIHFQRYPKTRSSTSTSNHASNPLPSRRPSRPACGHSRS
jgi:hypothetical protein